MARKLRLEYPGACYHVINRGNYRADVFATEGAKQAFEECLFEACAKSGWVLHAYVLMRNHYHLALETPQGNLAVGMQWLQATFANRFNSLRHERGHLFQGRYKAILVEAGDVMGLVCHYIHLNPVRAGVVSVERLVEYRHSSYWHLIHRKTRPKFLQIDTSLGAAGNLADNPAGWRRYTDYLAWQAAEGPGGRSKAYVSLSRGWALGTTGFKAALIKDHALAASARAWEGGGASEIRERGWEELWLRALRSLGRKEAEVPLRPRSAGWKIALAMLLKERTQVSNGWLARRMGIKNPVYVSGLISRARSAPPPELAKLKLICTT